MKVYLAGPITGLTYDGAEDWRQYAIHRLLPIEGISPLRGKDYLRNSVGPLSGHGREYLDLGLLSTPRAVMTRDHFDATRCDVLLANLAGADRVSIGTCFEIAWAFDRQIPVVAAIDEHGPMDHMFMHEAIGFTCRTLDEAIDVTRCILGA